MLPGEGLALALPSSIDFVLAEVQGLVVGHGLFRVSGAEIPVVLEAVEGICNMVAGLLEVALVPGIPEPGILTDQVFAGAEHGEEAATKGLAENISPFGVVPFAAVKTALGRPGVLTEGLLYPAQSHEADGQFFVGLAQLENISAFMLAAVSNPAFYAADGVQFGLDIVRHFGGNHPYLAFVGPGYKLKRFCHNSVQFKGLTYSTNDLTSDTFLTAAR